MSHIVSCRFEVSGVRNDRDVKKALQALYDIFAEHGLVAPDEWLEPVPGAETPDAVRGAYVAFLTARLGTRQWLPEAP